METNTIMMIALLLIQTVLFLILVVQFMRESEERQNINMTLMRVNQKLEDINMRLYKMEIK
jgi:Tfp pilus assembly protein PilN